MPAKAGIQNYLKTLDSRLRGNDVKGRFKTFYESIKFVIQYSFVSTFKVIGFHKSVTASVSLQKLCKHEDYDKTINNCIDFD